MTEEQQALIRGSFAKVAPNAEAVAAAFYARLFELDPSLRPLFKGDMAAQGRKLMAMIGTAVANLHQLGTVVPAVQKLGERHVQYGVKDADYATVGSALLWTLEQGLGDDFTPAMREAWTECYTTLAGVMQQAASDTAAT
jgi:hemoglobin-like flavoprotein